MPRKRLGDLLIEAGLITPEQLEKALAEQKVTGRRLGEVLTQSGVLSEDQLIEVMEFQLGIPHVDLDRFRADPAAVELVPEALARRYRVIPLKRSGNRLTLAMVDPLDYFAIDDIRMTTGLHVDPVIATHDDVDRALEQYYGLKQSVTEVLKEVRPEQVDEEQVRAEDAPIVRLVNQLIEQAADGRASDIHFDPQQQAVAVRFRIDGVLHTQMRLPKHLQPVLTARVKIMANLNIAEHRLPQDGRIQLKVRGRPVDVRVATLPTIFGEKIVLRLLDVRNAVTRIEDLGFSERNHAAFLSMIGAPHGIVLVTGPTGSGKTSTLYAALHHLNAESQNIITVEDPVEYQIDGVNQVQVNQAVGLTFAVGLRSILREDPNIIMVGEIRDEETAEIAVRAALTGHLVLSTLHTNDAPGSITRLMDMGVEPYLIASTLRGVVAQRLVRRVCADCREAYRLAADEAELLADWGLAAETLWRGRGCTACHRTGYRGRMAVHELLPVNEEIRALIAERRPAAEYRRAAEEMGYLPLVHDGLQKAVQGMTTVREVLNVIVDEG
ncbi:GspE/PulE family protein [Kyrpidia spormannii]|uniref:Type II secretion system protein E n=1 Tax=Kyrpidia spormannii TaxID=2055160 RepID=A0ACA8ZDR2_9BACL|nr:ATPase, T2SS/T4P/T4SS family [Kyrpidia spormannii]CAB3395427.1 Type II secretion system protein E [Kyrpidia spormannii]